MRPRKLKHKPTVLKYLGLVLMAFVLFTLISMLSYLFTWQPDQSIMSHPDMMSQNVNIGNAGGKLGYLWSRFLIADCFGLGSFVLVFLMGVASFRLIFRKRHIGLLKITLLSLLASFILSLALAYAASFGSDLAFGGGLGGYIGAALVALMNNLVGAAVTGLIIILLVVGWLILASWRFELWFSTEKERKPEKKVEEEKVEDTEECADTEEPEETEGPEESGKTYEAENAEETDDIEIADKAENSGETEKSAEPDDSKDSDDISEIPDVTIIKDDTFDDDIKEDLPCIDVHDELSKYEMPSLDLLDDYAESRHEMPDEKIKENNRKIITTLANYKIKVEQVTAVVGPTVTLYKVVPSPGVKVSQIKSLSNEIRMSLNSEFEPRIITLPDSVGIEVANTQPSIVPLKSVLNDESFRNSKAELPVAMGYMVTQKVKVFDLADAPHLLVAGATKQGKSVGLNVIIASLLYSKHPSELKFVFIDPKMVEFSAYNSLLKHYLAVLPSAVSEEDERNRAIVKDSDSAAQILESLCIEMDERYKLLSAAKVNNVKSYNEKYKDRHLLPDDGHRYMPYIVVILDEYADLTMMSGASGDARKNAGKITDAVIRLAQKGRAAGLHVIIATQRPSADVITGRIKSNFPTKVAFKVSQMRDSMVILDTTGAENLIGKGDMLYSTGVDTTRVQCAYISMKEISRLTSFIGKQTGYKKAYSVPYYLPMPKSSGDEGGGTIKLSNMDPMFEDAAKMVVASQRGSTSDLQRRLGMGYSRAGRVMDQLESAGIVGPQDGPKARQVLVSMEELDVILNSLL